MNQQINLYLPEFRKEKDRLSAVNMLAMLGVLAIGLALATAVKVFGTFQLSREVADKQATLQATREQTNSLVDSYGEQSEDPQLAAEVRQLEENLQGKRALLDFLDGRDIGNTDGFSSYLVDLSRYHVGGLRLTSIDLNNGGDSVLLHGEVNRAENVPLYLQNLSNGASYAGKTFETLKIANTSADDGVDIRMVFDVATTGSGGG